MNKKLLISYIFLNLAWCFFLNKLILLSALILLTSCIYHLVENKDIDYLKTFVLFSLISACFIMTEKISGIGEYYDGFSYFLIFMSLNLAILDNYQKNVKSNELLLILFISLSLLTLFLIIGIILPDSLYIYFPKVNLYTLIALIFLPNIITVSVSILKKIKIFKLIKSI